MTTQSRRNFNMKAIHMDKFVNALNRKPNLPARYRLSVFFTPTLASLAGHSAVTDPARIELIEFLRFVSGASAMRKACGI
jgi:hypothetical protein